MPTISVRVIYGAGGRPLDPIQDELIATESMAVRRGQAELDARYWSRTRRQVRCPYRGIADGDIVQVADALGPEGERYLVRAQNIVLEGAGKATQILDLEGAYAEP